MTNLVGSLNELLKPYHTCTRPIPRKIPLIEDEFLREAYSINDHIRSLHSYLLSIRRAYLSTAPAPRRNRVQASRSHQSPAQSLHLRDQDKDAIDASSKTLLRDASASLTQLSSANSIQYQTSERKLSARYKVSLLGKWAAGGGPDDHSEKKSEQIASEGELETLRVVRESMLWYLGKKLEAAGAMQADMMERRLQREVEKGRSVLYKVRSGNASGAPILAHFENSPRDQSQDTRERWGQTSSGKAYDESNSASGISRDEESRREIENQLTPDQLQLFASENQDMLKRYETTLDQVRTTEKSLYEISQLQSQLVSHLDSQSENISQLVTDSLSTTENVGGGNKQLARAAERKSTARMVFYASCGLCVTLVVWDMVF